MLLPCVKSGAGQACFSSGSALAGRRQCRFCVAQTGVDRIDLEVENAAMSGIPAIVHSTMTPGSAFASPEAVPTDPTSDVALANLSAGRPEGDHRELVVDGIRCPAVTAGNKGGAPVLCVHGLGHDMWDFAPFFDRAKDTLALGALDLPGFGLSEKPSRGYSLALLSQAVLEATSLFDAPPVVVASSLGGHVAMLAALAEPRAFSGLVLVSPGGLFRPPLSTRMIARAYYSERSIMKRDEKEIVANSRKIFAREIPAREILVARKLAVHRSPLRRVFARPFSRIVDDVFNHPVTSRVRKLKVPVSFIHGQKDVVVPTAPCAEAAHQLGAPFHLLEDVGHLPMVEAADDFARLVKDFVREHHG